MDRFWSLPRYPFRLEAVQVAPENSGVYALFDDEEVIFIGRAHARFGGLRLALITQLQLPRRGPMGHVTAYTWEIALAPEARESLLLARFIQEYLRFPRGQGFA